jgi:hypothetical protein
MGIDKKYEWAVAQNLAYRICCELDGFSHVIEDRDNLQIRITGNLALASQEFITRAKAKCKFLVDAHWPEDSPDVWCDEPWVKHGADWHVDYAGKLCWEYHRRWKDSIYAVTKEATLGNAAEYGTVWLVRSVRNLLNRHLFAHRAGIDSWRKEWDYWAHDQAVERQYLKSVKRITSER